MMTSNDPGPPDGIERRRERIDLSALTEDVRQLEEAVRTLAPAVTRILPNQVQLGVAEIRKLLGQIVVIAVMLGMALIVYSQVALAHLNQRVDRGHEVILCVLKVPEAQRTDQAVLTCEQGAR